MAMTLSHVVNLTLRNVAFKVKTRNLFSAAALGLENYISTREKVKNQFENVEDKFRERMKKYLESPNQNMVFTEDLKNMVHLIEKDEEDIELFLQMLKRFNSQNKELRFGTFVFGPVIMRMFYHLEKPDLGLKIISDKSYDGFFDQITSYQIIMDLLYEKKKYQDVLKVFDLLQDRQLYGSKYPRDCVLLVLAACYKMNTKESFDYTVKLIQGIREAGSTVLRKGITFAAALALKNNNPAIAMEILALAQNPNYVTVKNLRLMAMCEMDRLDEVFGSLNSFLAHDVPELVERRTTILPETMEKLKAAVDRNGSKEFQLQYKQIEKNLADSKRLSTETLDSIMCAQVPPRIFTNSGPPRRQDFPQKPNPMFRQRRGLTDFDD